MPRFSFPVVLTALVLALSTGLDARQRPPGPVHMKALRVQATVVDGVASTRLEQTWRNDGATEAEADWILPLPAGAVADGLTLHVNGVPLTGEVLDKDAARSVYEGIVRRRRDPALLEHFGSGCLRARIYPIPAHGETRVDVSFRSVLPELLGLREWSFALGAAGANGVAPESVVLELEIRSRKAIKNAFAPLAALQVVQKDDHRVLASYEGSAQALGSAPLAVFYGLSEAEFGLDLLTHRGAGDPEGTFLMLVSPKREWQQQETLRKSIAFVLDTSGSMEGQKIEQAKNALRLFLGSLGPEDLFDVVPFATEPEPFFRRRVPATTENVATALARVQGITAAGGTNIDAALAQALRGAGELEGRVPLVVFLTDGEPTVGVTGPDDILEDVRASAGGARVFVMGVGSSVNTRLLDSLASATGGARDYVREGERIDEKTRALFAKLAHPVLTDVQLTIDGLQPTKCVPARMPDLFAGDRIELFGRYAGEGAHAIRLSGTVAGVRREYVYEATFARETGGELGFLAPLWAERRVGQLLDAIRLNGANPELVQEVERLGRTYRIVTPYTSHLVVEPGLLGQRPATGGSSGPGSPGAGSNGRPATRAFDTGGVETGSDGFFLGHGEERRLADDLRELVRLGVLPAAESDQGLQDLALRVVDELRASENSLSALGYGGEPRSAVGEGAVDASQYLQRLMRGQRGDPAGAVSHLFTRRVRERTFVLRGGRWVDATLDDKVPEERRVVEAFSAEYFALLANEPELAPYLAFSPRLLLRWKGGVIEIVEPRPAPPEGVSR